MGTNEHYFHLKFKKYSNCNLNICVFAFPLTLKAKTFPSFMITLLVLRVDSHRITIAGNAFFSGVSPESFLTLVTLPPTKPLPRQENNQLSEITTNCEKTCSYTAQYTVGTLPM